MKKTAFFENTKLLNGYGTTPLMYGSLGLEYITGADFGADDVDILIPQTFTTDSWGGFSAFLCANGYILVDEAEHTFEKGGIEFSYGSLQELESFSGIRVQDIKGYTQDGAQFMALSLSQYLIVYNQSIKDGYRINVRQKKDADKIAFIENQIKKQNGNP